MTRPWLRLAADTPNDPVLVEAGEDALFCWFLVLCDLKANEGALSDAHVRPAGFARRHRIGIGRADAGLPALFAAGLLRRGSCLWRVQGGSERKRSGWVTARWCEYGNGPTESARIELEPATGANPADNARYRPITPLRDRTGQDSTRQNTDTGPPAPAEPQPTVPAGETESQPPMDSEQTPLPPQPEPVAPPSRPPKPDVAAAIARVWDRYRTLQADKAGVRRGEKPTKDVADGLRARLQEHGEDAVLAVVEWSHRSKHSRAVFLRDGKLLGTTLFRPKNFAEYLTFAQSAKAPPEKSADPLPYTRNISPTYSLPDDEWRDLTDAERAAVWRRHLEEEARVEAKRKVSAEEERKWAEALTPEKREEYEKQKRRIEERKAADAAANPMRRMTV